MAAFSIFHFEGLIKHDPKYVKMETSATRSLYFGGKQSSNHDKEINTVNETPAWPNKKNASSRRHERINTNKV